MEKSFGKKMWAARRRMFLTQAEAAKRIGICEGYYRAIENNKCQNHPSEYVLQRIKLKMGI